MHHTPIGSQERIHDRARPGADVHPDGHKPQQREATRPVVINRTINNTTVINNVRNHVINENTRGGRWWHENDGVRYYHYVDHAGLHWFGFYIGATYFYTRWYMDHFWWQDPYWHRWCYWREGHWWYVDGDVTYIFENDNYYRYEDTTGGVVITPAPPDDAPTPDDGEAGPPPVEQTDQFFYSEDGYRTVQIHLGQAFLYDRTQQNADGGDLLIAELTTDTPDTAAKDVKFSKQQGDQLQILVIYDDGTFARFDAWGRRLDAADTQTQPEVVPVPVPPAGDGADRPDEDAPLRKSLHESENFKALQGLGAGWNN